MPQLSRRADAMPASPIRKLAPLANQAKSEGVHIYHLNIGQPDVPSPPLFWEAIANCGLDVLEYSASDGLIELKEGMAAYYEGQGIDVEAKHVVVTTAGSEALQFAMLSCLDQGDNVIVPEPMYANYIGFARAAQVEVKPIPTSIDFNFRLPTVEEFAERIDERTRAVLICNPGNPTGTIYSDEQLQGLRELCLEHDLFLIGDEVYRLFNYTQVPTTSVLQLPGMDEHAVMIDSVSKRFSLCGARVGFLVTRNEAVLSGAVRMAQARLSPPMLEQLAVVQALETPDSYFQEVREEYRRRRDLLVNGLRSMAGVSCPRIDGAFYAMVELPVDDVDKFASWLLSDFRHEGSTLMIAPGSGFYTNPEHGRTQARIAYVLDCERLAKALEVLRAALAVYPGRTCDQPAAVTG